MNTITSSIVGKTATIRVGAETLHGMKPATHYHLYRETPEGSLLATTDPSGLSSHTVYVGSVTTPGATVGADWGTDITARLCETPRD